ncbi:MAG: sigma-70 family RNA polymerase sigma factor [Leptolyngbya sp. PLA3]|nr:MAG: sigma-70 family RNA polymerase sigma factor [Cyanobacteria bacterium CYA]MCE7968914.1 sigma-70 family RNA polymerase sigma factor [Leptolyngbya sp. PL-A3]
MNEQALTETRDELAAAMRGNQDALRAVWRSHRAWVAAILLAHKPRESELEDLLQTVALTLVRRIGDVRDEGAFRSWLRTVAINVARAAGRKQATERRARLRLADRCQVECAEAGVGQDGRSMLDLARQLPDGYSEPLLLRCVKGMSYREISKVLELPETTIETRIARGRRMLRELATRREAAGGVESGAALEGVTDV